MLAAAESLEPRVLLSAMTFEVTNTADTGEGSLRAAIGLANANEGADTIVFGRRARGEIALTSQLIITGDLLVDGPGAHRLTVSGEGTTRVFAIVSANPAETIDVEIRDLTIANGFATDAIGYPPELGFAFGGGIYNLANNLALSGVRLENNLAGTGIGTFIAAGGAVANEFGGSLTVIDSQFVDNETRSQVISVGGAISQDVGPTLDREGSGSPSLSVVGSRFDGNRAETLETNPAAAGDFAPFAGFAAGGAIANFAGTATVAHSTFTDNSARGGDGINGNAGGTALGGAVFTADFTPFDFTGPPGRDSSLLVEHASFVGNSVVGGNGDGTGTGGAANGGAIVASISFFPDTGTVRHSSFTRNSAIGGDGGAAGGIGGQGSGGAVALVAGGSLVIEHDLFRDNLARGGRGRQGAAGGEGRGGAIGLSSLATPGLPGLFDALLPSADVRSGLFIGNRAVGGTGGASGGTGGEGNGGAIGLADGATANVSWSLLVANSAQGGRGGRFGGTGGNGQGGGISNGDASTTLTGTATLFNHARGGRGGAGGDAGEGLGGGLFNESTFDIDLVSGLLTRLNRATDDGDDFFGELTLL